MSQILSSPLSGWLNISASGASFSGVRDFSALVSVEFLPAGGQQVFFNHEHNHDAVYSPVAHNHNDIYSLLDHTHSFFSGVSSCVLSWIGSNSGLGTGTTSKTLSFPSYLEPLFFIYSRLESPTYIPAIGVDTNFDVQIFVSGAFSLVQGNYSLTKDVVTGACTITLNSQIRCIDQVGAVYKLCAVCVPF